MRYLVICLFLVAPGCALLQPADIPVSQTLPKPAQEVQKLVNEANVLLLATANVVRSNHEAGIITDAERAKYRVTLQELAARVDGAQALLRLGDITNAKTQADVLNAAILALHKEVAAKARTK